MHPSPIVCFICESTILAELPPYHAAAFAAVRPSMTRANLIGRLRKESNISNQGDSRSSESLRSEASSVDIEPSKLWEYDDLEALLDLLGLEEIADPRRLRCEFGRLALSKRTEVL